MFMQRRDFNLIGLVPCFLILLFFIGTGFAQITWQRTYGGASGDYGYSVQQTTDGGYIVAGSTYSFGNYTQVYLIKVDSLGDIVWSKTYGGSGYDHGRCVRQTMDGGYIITGHTNSFGNGMQVYLIKTDSLGDTLWTRTYDSDTIDEYGWSVRQTPDKGYIITGWTYASGNNRDVLLIKTDSLGNTLWTRTYGGEGRDDGRCVQQTPDGGYIIVGSFNVPWLSDPVYLIKTDSIGDTLWTRTYGQGGRFGYSVHQTDDGGYIITGDNTPFGIARAFLIKTDSLGDSLWSKEYLWGDQTGGHCVVQTFDHCYVLAGWAFYIIVGNPPQEYNYCYLVKTDSLGDTLWTRLYGDGTGEYQQGAWCIQQTTDSGYIFVGTYWAQVYLVKTDKEGNVAGLEESNRIPPLSHRPHPIVSPNPFVSFTKVIGYEQERFLLYDVSGRRVGSYLGDRIGLGLPVGVYFLLPEDKSLKPVRVMKVK